MDQHPPVVAGSHEPVLEPFTVYGGYRPAWTLWVWRRGERDQEHTFVGETVFPTREACIAEIALIKARSL